MNYLDIIIIIPILYAVWKGFKKGFIIELFTLLALFAGLYAGIHFSDFAAESIVGEITTSNQYAPLIAFTLTFLAVGAMVYFAGKAIEKVVDIVHLTPINKLVGIVLSVIKMIFFIGGIILMVESYDEKSDILPEKAKEESLLYTPIKKTLLFIIPAFNESTIFVKNALNDKSFIDKLRERHEE